MSQLPRAESVQADLIRDVEKCKRILKAVDETKGSVQGKLN